MEIWKDLLLLSTAALKFQSVSPSCMLQQDCSEKLCHIGPCCALAELKVTVKAMLRASASEDSHFNVIRPRPAAFWKLAPPLPLVCVAKTMRRKG